MSRRQPDRESHDRFCRTEDWKRVRDARGRTGTHHVVYELVLHDGRILRTRISHPVDRTGYGPGIWSHILRDQLDVTDEEFWGCVLDKVLPHRGRPELVRDALPADLVHLLLTRVGLSEREVAAMSKDEAVARVQRHWTDGS